MTPDDDDLSPAEVLGQLLAASGATQPVAVAAEFGIADILATGPRSSEEIAAAAGARPELVHRLMRALAALDVFAEADNGRWALAPPGALLRRDVPGSLRDAAILSGEPWRAATLLLGYAVRTGESAFERAFRRPLYDYLAAHPASHARFHAVQAAHWAHLALPAVDALPRARRVVDVGGGTGTLLAMLLAALPDATGALADTPEAVATARANAALIALGDRVEFAPTDFFERVPPGDLLVLAFVLHNYDDDRAARILARCGEALDRDGRVLLVENVLPERGVSVMEAMLDLEMLVYTAGGRERTEPEFRALLARAGFELVRATPSGAGRVCWLEARRA